MGQTVTACMNWMKNGSNAKILMCIEVSPQVILYVQKPSGTAVGFRSNLAESLCSAREFCENI